MTGINTSIPSSQWRRPVEAAITLFMCGIGLGAGYLMIRTEGESSRAAPPVARHERIPLLDAPALGDPGARIGMAIFSDFDCRFCKQFATEVLPALRRTYVVRGQLQIHFRHLPLTAIHPAARHSAEGAVCAAAQGRFWEMHDVLFTKPAESSSDLLQAQAVRAGVDPQRFGACLQGDGAPAVRRDIDLAGALGITATPAFALGVVQRGDVLQIEQVVLGGQPLQFFSMAIERLLASAR